MSTSPGRAAAHWGLALALHGAGALDDALLHMEPALRAGGTAVAPTEARCPHALRAPHARPGPPRLRQTRAADTRAPGGHHPTTPVTAPVVQADEHAPTVRAQASRRLLLHGRLLSEAGRHRDALQQLARARDLLSQLPPAWFPQPGTAAAEQARREESQLRAGALRGLGRHAEAAVCERPALAAADAVPGPTGSSSAPAPPSQSEAWSAHSLEGAPDVHVLRGLDGALLAEARALYEEHVAPQLARLVWGKGSGPPPGFGRDFRFRSGHHAFYVRAPPC